MTATPSSTASPNTDNSSSSRKSVVVGCAVGIPLSLALVGLLAFLFFRRHRRRRCSDNSLLAPPTISGYQEKSPRISELDGFPRAAGGSIAPHRGSAMAQPFYAGKAGSGRHGRTASEADGTPVAAKERRRQMPPAELEATEAGTGAGYFRGPTTAAAAARVASSQASSPGPTGYAVGATAPGGLRIVNVVEGELEDSEVDGEGEGERESWAKSVEKKVESPPPSYQSPKTWLQGRWGESWRSAGGAGEGSSSAAAAGAAPGSIGSPVSPLQNQGPGGWR
ncbi:hypothetical protein BKCO1_6700056 [Neofusicoccum parvum]|nr:hypothetical protein BKCO1_6700056 [Neofusicoccum parvum]